MPAHRPCKCKAKISRCHVAPNGRVQVRCTKCGLYWTVDADKAPPPKVQATAPLNEIDSKLAARAVDIPGTTLCLPPEFAARYYEKRATHFE